MPTFRGGSNQLVRKHPQLQRRKKNLSIRRKETEIVLDAGGKSRTSNHDLTQKEKN